tara:strand:- start:784 stop:1470 length:687 start_codon:yes stop_codon:yes gene_type:complete
LSKITALLRPAHEVPTTVWSADDSRNLLPRLDTLFFLLSGLWVFGTGEALIINARLGVSPWTVLAQGIGLQLDWTIGFATFIVSIAVLIMWIPLRETPGLGTLLNAVLIAAAIDIMMPLLPEPSSWTIAVIQAAVGVLMVGAGSCFYLTANLGPGPRDGWMTSIQRRTGWPIGQVRTGIEISVLIAGWMLGGTVGLGTLFFALGVGPALAGFLTLAGFWDVQKIGAAK